MKIGDTYKIVIEVNERLLTYTGKIISDDGTFITFKDKFDQVFSYNKTNIISFEEVGR